MTSQRDIIKTAQYFQSYIELKRKNIAAFTSTAHITGDKAHRMRLRYSIFKDELELWIARYSAGENIDLLGASFGKVVESLEQYQQEEGSGRIDFDGLTDYIQSLWMVSIVLLTAGSDKLFDRTVAAIGQTGKDAVFDRLIKLRYPQQTVSRTICHPKAYFNLYKAVFIQGEKREPLLRSFIDDYYRRVSGVYWMDADPETGNYFGRWLFELAAFVKGLKIDDRSFIDNVHYPKDMVHELH